jgi:hypothetical protein
VGIFIIVHGRQYILLGLYIGECIVMIEDPYSK